MFSKAIRRFATESQGLRVSFGVPHKALMTDVAMTQVNLSSTDGDMGILAGHVPVVLQLKPSVITLIGTETQKFFVSGGFAVVNPDSTLNINCVEAVELKELDLEATRKALEAATKAVSGTSDPIEKATAEIQVEVLEAVLNAK